MKIKNFNINRNNSDFIYNKVSYIKDGLMSAEDNKKLTSLSEYNITLSTKISSINITGPSKEELKPYFDSVNSNLSSQSERIEQIDTTVDSVLIDYCGRVWDESTVSPTAKTYCGNLYMLQHLPEILGLGCYLVQNDHSRRKLDPNNHYRFETGEEAKLDGSMGHYQWGWNKPFYIATWNEGDLFYECISLSPIKGKENYYVPVGSMSACGNAAVDREEDRLVSYINYSPRYRGGDNNPEFDNDPIKSALGTVVGNKDVYYFMEAARKNGKGWYSGTVRATAVLVVLFHIIMGTRDCQAKFNPDKDINGLRQGGLGYLFSESSYANVLSYDNYKNFTRSNPFIKYDKEDILLTDSVGLTKEYNVSFNRLDNNNLVNFKYKIPIFFGLKCFFSYTWVITEDEFVQHVIGSSTTHYIRKSMYDDNYTIGEVNDSVYTGTTFSKYGIVYLVRELSYKNLEMFISGDSSNEYRNKFYYCDCYNTAHNFSNSLVSIIQRYGSLDVYYSGGVLNCDASRPLTYIAWNAGTTLCEFTEDFLLEPIIG